MGTCTLETVVFHPMSCIGVSVVIITSVFLIANLTYDLVMRWVICSILLVVLGIYVVMCCLNVHICYNINRIHNQIVVRAPVIADPVVIDISPSPTPSTTSDALSILEKNDADAVDTCWICTGRVLRARAVCCENQHCIHEHHLHAYWASGYLVCYCEAPFVILATTSA